MTSPRLEKWYFDCLAPDGASLVGYAARATWGLFGLSYGARTTKANGDPACCLQSLSFGRVDEAGPIVRWANDRLRVRGEWSGGTPIPPIAVVDEPSGRIEWGCLGANCAVEVHVDGRVMMGTGYAEKLSMTIAPWSLPFSQLRWGRYISDDRDHFAVWIDMRGSKPRTLVWSDSAVAVPGTVHDQGVSTTGAELRFLSSEPLRSANVARTLLGHLWPLARLLPRGARSIYEEKQISRCELRCGESRSSGSSINEVVTWGLR